jgi:hypothetical protein
MYYTGGQTSMRNVTVRRSTSGDAAALSRLAALDSASPPRGPALVAEADSRMLAALPIGSGRPIADPFEPTAELVALLDLRRSQIESAEQSGAGRRRGLRGLIRGRLSHAA